MSESDPFGAASKPKFFDPDAPIAKTSAAAQMMSEFPPGWEEEAPAQGGEPEQPKSSVLVFDEAPAAKKRPPPKLAARSKFVRPKPTAAAAASSDAADDDIVIAVPKSRPTTAAVDDSSASSSSASAAAAADPTPAAAAPRPAAAPLDLDANPFGSSSKSRFDPDAPIAKTAASQFMSEYPPGEEEPPAAEESAPQPPKPRVARKPLLKKTTPAPAAATKPNEDATPAGADDVPPASSSGLSNSPPMKPIAAPLSGGPSEMSEFPDQAGEEVFSGPLDARLVHKNWKARAQAYEELRTLLAAVSDDDDDARRETTSQYESFLKKMVNDVSVPALEAGFQAAAVWVDKASFDHGAPGHADMLMTAVLKKGFGGRPATKTAADSISMLLIECGAADAVLTQLITGTQSNVPKIASSCAALLVLALTEFGPGVVAFEKLQKALPKILAHVNNGVRKEAMDLACELYRWMGAIFTNHLKTMSLKSSQEKELESLFEKVTQGQARPTKFVRSEAGKAAAAGGKKGKGAAAADAPFDPMALVKPVDIGGKLSKGWCDKAVNEKKWQDKKERLTELLTLAEATAKIEVTPALTDAIGALKKCLKDSNVVIVGDALKCLGALAKGTRRGFYSSARQLFPTFIQLMKEKKSTVSIPLTQCLDTIAELGVVEIPDVLEQLVEGLADKVSKVRIEVCQYLQRWFAQPRVTDKLLKDSVKPLGDALYKVLNDAEVDVRNHGTAALAELVATVGRRPLQDLLKKLEAAEAKRYQKLDQLINASKKNTGASSSAAEPEEEVVEEVVRSKPAAAAVKKVVSKRPATASAASAEERDEKKPLASSASSSGLGKPAKKLSTGALGKPSRAERPSSISSAPTPAASEKEAEDSDGVIRRVDLNAKAARIKRDTKRVKGTFREWGSDEIEEMSDALRALSSDDLHTLLLHKDFAKQMAGIDLLDAQVDSHFDALVSVSDLLFKWLAWRLCDANTSLLMKALAFTHHFLTALVSHEYRLSDGEASNFLPFLIEKVFGHNTDRFRNEARELVTICQTIYAPKMVFSALVVGYESKNKRVFSECLSESGAMIVKYGLQVCDAKKVLITMAQTVGANESHVRTAALGALSAVYTMMGEGIWTYLGSRTNNAKIQPKQMAMIEARFKTIKPQVTAPPVVEETAAPAASAHMSAAAAAVAKSAGPHTPRRIGKLPNSSPSGSPLPPPSKSAQVSPRNSISGLAVPTPRRSVQTPVARPATASFGGLPGCFSLDLEVPTAFPDHHHDAHFSRTAPSSPGHNTRTLAPSVQSATTSPHGRVPLATTLATSSILAKSLGKPQLIVPKAGSLTDPPLVEQLLHYMDSNYATHLSDDEKMDVMRQLWEIALDRASALVGESDEIVAFIMRQVESCFVEREGILTINHRLCRYALNTLLELFKVEEVASGVKMKSEHTERHMRASNHECATWLVKKPNLTRVFLCVLLSLFFFSALSTA